MNDHLLGILGGLGPMSGIYFCESLTAHTLAHSDAEHINFLLSSRADTPDRSSFIIGSSSADPSPIMAREAKRLQDAGATVLAIPCNTAHYFYDRICEAVDIPVINIITETALYCKHRGFSKIGVLCTEGTARSRAYEQIFTPHGIEIEPLTEREQSVITHIIFDCIKGGEPYDSDEFMRVAHALTERGAETLILGCTELSLIKKSGCLPSYFTDSLELLALAAIRKCQKRPTGFDAPLMQYYLDTQKED